ncbi:hypothetical protein [Xenorhabdus cabanillasii]|uniref:Uncharacterized protein n=1 Tax=Xenorhabdus cabanillasii JM26 TaxID=1427517 RepID=W1IMP6_9GAMM|nr:hypothetical protein [Xenorhabdus cabanillasii]CDL79103.1 hypothetical protein XCR1_1040028 [Xenorhabdus cabanillasii JM26]
MLTLIWIYTKRHSVLDQSLSDRFWFGQYYAETVIEPPEIALYL